MLTSRSSRIAKRVCACALLLLASCENQCKPQARWLEMPPIPDTDGGAMFAVTRGGPGLVGVGMIRPTSDPNGEIAAWTSITGESWPRTAPAAGTPTDLGDQHMLSVVRASVDERFISTPYLIAGGYDNGRPAVWKSVDAVTWRKQVLGGSGIVMDVTEFSYASDPHLVAMGELDRRARVWVSRDHGETWMIEVQEAPHEWATRLNAVSYIPDWTIGRIDYGFQTLLVAAGAAYDVTSTGSYTPRWAEIWYTDGYGSRWWITGSYPQDQEGVELRDIGILDGALVVIGRRRAGAPSAGISFAQSTGIV